MPAFEFVSQSKKDTDNRAADSERLLNLYAEPLGSTAQYSLKSVLGTEQWGALDGVFLRAAEVVEGVLYGVIGARLHSVSAVGSGTILGTVPDDAFTTMAGNNGDVCVSAGGQYFVWNGTTLLTPTGGNFSDVGAIEFLGGYTVMAQRNGRRFQWSDLAAPETLTGLNFATAEQRDDKIVRLMAISGNLWIFKESSIEIWQQAGTGAEAFSLIPGAVIETGLKAFNLITKIPDGAFFVGDDDICYLAQGGRINPVPGVAVQTAITEGNPTNCFYYEDEGHKFCVIRFFDRAAWVLDIATGLWHERGTGDGPWQATLAVNAYGKWRVGAVDGSISTLVRNSRDIDQPLVREAISGPLYFAGDRFKIPKLEARGRVGFSDIGRDATVVLNVSRDGGLTWGSDLPRSMGALGQYDTRMVWRQLGQSRQFTIKLRITDPAELTLYSSCNAEITR